MDDMKLMVILGGLFLYFPHLFSGKKESTMYRF